MGWSQSQNFSGPRFQSVKQESWWISQVLRTLPALLPSPLAVPLPAGTECVRKVVHLTSEECDNGLPCIVPTVTRASCPRRPAKLGHSVAHNWELCSEDSPRVLRALVCRSPHKKGSVIFIKHHLRAGNLECSHNYLGLPPITARGFFTFRVYEPTSGVLRSRCHWQLAGSSQTCWQVPTRRKRSGD